MHSIHFLDFFKGFFPVKSALMIMRRNFDWKISDKSFKLFISMYNLWSAIFDACHEIDSNCHICTGNRIIA